MADIASEQFHKDIEQYIADAETHMQLPPSTIGNAWFDNDFVFVLKMCGVIEPLLKEAVREHIRKAVEYPKVAIEGTDGLLKAITDLGIDRLRNLLRGFGVIHDTTNDFLSALFQVRNRYAHHIANAHLTVKDVCEKVAAEPNGDKRLVAKLAGFHNDHEAKTLRLLMFYHTAFFLRAAVYVVRPPPLPSDGILSQFLREKFENDGPPPSEADQ